MPGNGSCFYHSVALQLKDAVLVGSLKFSASVTSLRNMVAAIMEAALKHPNSEYYSLLLYYSDEQNMSPKKYIAQTRKCMWAGPLEIQILATLLKKRIQVYSNSAIKKHKQSNGKYNLSKVTPVIDFGDKRRQQIKIVILGYNPNNNEYGVHYDALVK